MTLTVALDLEEGMVFATDSRGTIGDPRGLTAQNDTIKKVYILSPHTILTISGSNETGAMVIDELKEKCKEKPYSTTGIMLETRKVLIERYNEWFPNFPIVPLPNSGVPERPTVQFSIGGFDKAGDNIIHRLYLLPSHTNFSPMLFNTNMCLTGVPQYAVYLLHRLFSRAMNMDQSLALAAYVITETATQDGKVGGPLQMVRLANDNEAKELSSTEIDEVITSNMERAAKLRELFFQEVTE